MRKISFALLAVILSSYATVAQVSSGTIIIINLSKNELVVAADSRGMYNDRNRPPDDLQCKVATFDHETLFATGGTAVRFNSLGLDQVNGWNNIDFAKAAVDYIGKTPPGDDRVQAIGHRWADLLVENWLSDYRWHPEEVIKAAETGKGILTYGLIAEAATGLIYPQVVKINFDASVIPPVFPQFFRGACDLRCGQKEGHNICAYGQTDIVTRTCSTNPKFLRQDRPRNWDRDELFADWLAKMARACDLTETVGGPIDVVSPRTDGRVTWRERKNNCPDN
jgi:hypothetical protein